jgi:hypothetical protein
MACSGTALPFFYFNVGYYTSGNFVYEMGWTYSYDVGKKKCIQNFNVESALIAIACKTSEEVGG